MEKAQLELFRAIRAGDIPKARKAYEKGANVNWPLDKWMMGGHQHWGLRVHVKPLGIYLGFSARESWKVPVGEGADRGDTLVMVALKCRMREAVAFLLGCERLNPNCLNEAGNSAADIARATGQSFLLTGTSMTAGAGAEYEEALPAWEQGVRTDGGGSAGGAGLGAGDVQYASVVAEAVPMGPTAPAAPDGVQLYATAEAVGDMGYSQTGTATAATVTVTMPMQRPNNPVGRGTRQHNPYDPSDGGGRANLAHGTAGRAGTAGLGANLYGTL